MMLSLLGRRSPQSSPSLRGASPQSRLVLSSGTPLWHERIKDVHLEALAADHAAALLPKLAPRVDAAFRGRLREALQSRPPSALEVALLSGLHVFLQAHHGRTAD